MRIEIEQGRTYEKCRLEVKACWKIECPRGVHNSMHNPDKVNIDFNNERTMRLNAVFLPFSSKYENTASLQSRLMIAHSSKNAGFSSSKVKTILFWIATGIAFGDTFL
jgi:hypothetical protein